MQRSYPSDLEAAALDGASAFACTREHATEKRIVQHTSRPTKAKQIKKKLKSEQGHATATAARATSRPRPARAAGATRTLLAAAAENTQCM